MTWTCYARAGCRSCSTVCTRPPPSGRCCGSSASATPASWNRCCANTWSRWPNAPELLVGIDEQAFIDIDSLLRPVYGHAKQGASYGHTKIAGKQVLRKGLSPLATTISTAHCRAADRRDAATRGQDRLGKGAGRMIAQAIATARAAGPRGKILVRGDSGLRQPRGRPRLLRGKAEFSLVMTKNRAIAPGHRRDPGHRLDPGALPRRGPGSRHGAWISDAEVAEVPYTAFAAHQGPDHRPAHRAPGLRRPLPRRAVPGVALPPVLHQLRPDHRRHRYRPPPPAITSKPCSPTSSSGPFRSLARPGTSAVKSAWALCAVHRARSASRCPHPRRPAHAVPAARPRATLFAIPAPGRNRAHAAHLVRVVNRDHPLGTRPHHPARPCLHRCSAGGGAWTGGAVLSLLAAG